MRSGGPGAAAAAPDQPGSQAPIEHVPASGTYGEPIDASGKLLKRDAFAYGGRAGSPPALPHNPQLSKLGTGPLHIFTVDSLAGSGLRYRAAAFPVGDGRTLWSPSRCARSTRRWTGCSTSRGWSSAE